VTANEELQTSDCYAETFNGSLSDECLNVHWLETIEDAKATIETRRRDYNDTRPHRALKDVAPEEYARNSGVQSADGINRADRSYLVPVRFIS
jgi:putative transposase